MGLGWVGIIPFGKTMVKLLKDNFLFTGNDFIKGYHKWGEVFILSHTQESVFLLFVLLLCVQHIVDGAVYIRFFIFVHHVDINYGVSLVLPRV